MCTDYVLSVNKAAKPEKTKEVGASRKHARNMLAHRDRMGQGVSSPLDLSPSDWAIQL